MAETGGHLASNLGTVELTLALLSCFDFRHDKVVWDVGHQSYSYKILTGRREAFASLRSKDGLSGFPKREESPYDSFNTGHSSTAVSAALGLERAMKKRGESGRVLAIVGDGAMTGGMFYEAINNIDHAQDDLLIIINDNQMSISDNVGALARHLNNLRVSRRYNQAKRNWSRILLKLPLIGHALLSMLNHVKDWLRFNLNKSNDNIYFETLGLRYYGPVDGHDLQALNRHMLALKNRKGPAVLHVCTQKGKGYHRAEAAPSLYHGVSPFSLDEGVIESPLNKTQHNFTQAFASLLLEEAALNPDIVAITAAMGQGTGLEVFAARYPERFYDVGIAEPHAVTMAAGMAAGGLRPVVCIYATFLQRALDQLVHDVALQNLPVLFAIDRAGIVGNDGETHQGIYDNAFLSAIPNIEIYYPSCYEALRLVLRQALRSAEGPVAVRYPRGTENALCAAAFKQAAAVKAANSEDWHEPLVLKKGTDISLLVLGQLCGEALQAAENLATEGIAVEVIDVFSFKPLRMDLIMKSALKSRALLTIEEQSAAGGLGEVIAAELLERGLNLTFATLHIPDMPVVQAKPKESWQDCCLDASGIEAKIRELLHEKAKDLSA